MKAAIFDLDGTLIDSMGIWDEIDRESLESRGIAVPDDLRRIVKNLSFVASAVYHVERFSMTETVEELIDEWNKTATRAYAETIEVKEGALELLKKFNQGGIKLALATATARPLAEAALKRYGILDYFQIIAIVDEVGFGKEDPAFFSQVAGMLGLKPEECLVVEDSLHAVQGAKGAGMTVWAVYDDASAHERAELEQIADRYLLNLNEVLEDETIGV